MTAWRTGAHTIYDIQYHLVWITKYRYPTGRWPLNRFIADAQWLAIRPEMPSGIYTVTVGLWDRYREVRMHVLDVQGNLTEADSIVLTNTLFVQP